MNTYVGDPIGKESIYLRRIKHSQVISMEKFRPTVLSFGKGIFFSGSYFILGHLVEGEDHHYHNTIMAILMIVRAVVMMLKMW